MRLQENGCRNSSGMQAYLQSTYIGHTTSVCKEVYTNMALPSRCVGCGQKQAEQHSVLRWQTKDYRQRQLNSLLHSTASNTVFENPKENQDCRLRRSDISAVHTAEHSPASSRQSCAQPPCGHFPLLVG